MADPRWTNLDDEWFTRMDKVRAAVESWRELILEPDAPEPNSALAEDDLVLPAMPCSQLAWVGITSGVEHLDAAMRLIDQQVGVGGPLLPSANFTVLRAALVGASQAAVLLLPDAHLERTTYGLQIAHEELEQVRRLMEYSLNHPATSAEISEQPDGDEYIQRLVQRRDMVRRALAERGLRRDARKLTDTAMITRAGELVYENDPSGSLLALGVGMEWRMGSGAAHGRLLIALHRGGSHKSEEAQGTALLGASPQEIGQQVANVSLMLDAGWKAWDARTKTPQI